MSAGSNTVISGPSVLRNQDLTGLSVAEVRSRFQDSMNIPEDASASINGIPVDEEQVLVNGEEVLFAKPLGQKGR